MDEAEIMKRIAQMPPMIVRVDRLFAFLLITALPMALKDLSSEFVDLSSEFLDWPGFLGQCSEKLTVQVLHQIPEDARELWAAMTEANGE